MKKIKYILVSIPVIILLLIVFLFAVQGIDSAINKKVYLQISNFFTEIKDINNKNDCLKNYSFVLQKTRHMHKNVSKELAASTFYDNTINLCSQYKTEIDNINIPDDMPKDKKALLTKYKEQRNVFADYVIKDLNMYAKCKGDYVCISEAKKTSMPFNFEFGKVVTQAHITALEAQKRLSFDYYYKVYPIQLKDIKRLNKLNDVLDKYKKTAK